MTEPPIILDADFVSSFAWVNRLDILQSCYFKRMIILEEVFSELSRVPHLASRVATLVDNGVIERKAMLANSPEALVLAEFLDTGKFGTGEAACMAYLTHHDGILASNNLTDVKLFCTQNGKQLLTTAEVFRQTYKAGRMTIAECDSIWTEMLSKRRKLPARSFSDYLSFT